MKKLTKQDELKERLGIEMDHIKAQMLELKAKGRKLGLEARKDLDKQLLGLEKKQAELKVRLGEWAKAGEKAGSDVKAGLERAAKELKKALDSAASRLK
ncbi:MAG: hypothetical protein H6P95_2523 [Candidatus Aminicenantes bacterium]|jgi:peptidoglycan hydrolase CwlO-like protein|nr:hypothetical protein [Candidatus Aminicenantes bacterium]